MYATFNNKTVIADDVKLADDEETNILLPSNEAFEVKSTVADKNASGLMIKLAALFVAVTVLVVILSTTLQSSSTSHPIVKPIPKSTKTTNKLVLSPQKTGGASSTRPNIIVMVADDLGFGSVNPDDNTLETVRPTLTALLNDGIFFDNYYTQEVCSPARASLLTGRYPSTIGMQFNLVSEMVAWGMNLSETTIAQALQDYGDYKTYAVGKWHLGHYQPKYLPTARGFDHYMGYLSGENYYWSKKSPVYDTYSDMLYMDSTCYTTYSESDLTDYSTYLFSEKTRTVLNSHDFDSNPLFMYLAFQSVHDPFHDISGDGINGIPESYVGEEFYSLVESTFSGSKRQQYVLSLYLMDREISKIMSTLEDLNQLENTYLLFVSDNGGCYKGGGRNGGLRGCKGSLFEGGTHVDAFIHSALIPEELRGSTYGGLMHVSDLFPTIMELAGLDYEPTKEHTLDGVSHKSAILNKSDSPRDSLLYNL
jgi:arylsulfatase A-like enzyme